MPLTDWRRGATVLGDAVLSRCPRWLVFMSGVGEASLACQPLCQGDSDVTACLELDFDYECVATPLQTPLNHFWGGNLEGALVPGGVPTLREPARLGRRRRVPTGDSGMMSNRLTAYAHPAVDSVCCASVRAFRLPAGLLHDR